MRLVQTAPSRAPARLMDGERIYAVGDVHGCVGHLASLHRHIADDLAARPVSDTTIVHLGDYIDRGPDSAGVLEWLLSPPPALAACKMIHLRGNHEAMFLAALDGDDVAEAIWLMNGGGAAISSWGGSLSNWRHSIPERHIEWVRRTRLFHSRGGYVFVHAGLNPDLSLEDQDPDDLVWIREPFLQLEGELGHVVVHGHTVEGESPTVMRHRIGVDTGAVFGGALTCVVLEGPWMRFIAVSEP